MALLMPLKEKKLTEVKLQDLSSWILMLGFTPSGIAGAFWRGYDQYYKYISVRKGRISGINTVLAAYMVFSYCISYKELKYQQVPLKRGHCGGHFTAEHGHLPRSNP
ncbi:ATP synthase subunit f, mitochondrial-like [Mus pahari]|uniref:ATP synthase subunit f, mitochondrial-like n=1 Tax=Mus pahari TaxID=10093 RepID=UPI000A307873|nr:ATP synthase subunit f, mitochondrial-like [Mus pahari]